MFILQPRVNAAKRVKFETEQYIPIVRSRHVTLLEKRCVTTQITEGDTGIGTVLF